MARRRARLALLSAVLALGALVTWLVATAPGPKPGWKTFTQVRRDMTREQVVATVGGPPGDYRTRTNVYPIPPDTDWPEYDFWVSDEAQMCVRFGPDDRVDGVITETVLDQGQSQPSMLQRLRGRLGL